jgi:hypothetical protein
MIEEDTGITTIIGICICPPCPRSHSSSNFGDIILVIVLLVVAAHALELAATRALELVATQVNLVTTMIAALDPATNYLPIYLENMDPPLLIVMLMTDLVPEGSATRFRQLTICPWAPGFPVIRAPNR